MKIGFIGCGNMARAMIGGILGKGAVTSREVMASDLSEQALAFAQNELGISAEKDNKKVAGWADILVLAVKPQFIAEMIQGIKDTVKEDTIIVSLAPGKTLDWLTGQFGRKLKLIRTMPNTPAMVGEGMTALCSGETVSSEELETVRTLFQSFGRAEVVPEKLMDAVVGVSGSSPAFVFLFLEALADAAVAEGMPRKQAYEFAAQTVLGSAKLMLETGKHPGELKDMVCSPGGTTIEGVAELEDGAFRSTVIRAVRAAAERSREL